MSGLVHAKRDHQEDDDEDPYDHLPLGGIYGEACEGREMRVEERDVPPGAATVGPLEGR